MIDLPAAVERAIASAQMAYSFAPGSYTYGALSACMTLRTVLSAPQWEREYLAWQDYKA